MGLKEKGYNPAKPIGKNRTKIDIVKEAGKPEEATLLLLSQPSNRRGLVAAELTQQQM